MSDLEAIFSQIAVEEVISPQVAIDLQTLNKARNYRRWLYSLTAGALGHRILDMGSGVGNYAEFFLSHGDVWVTDLESTYTDVLEARFGTLPNCRVSQLTLESWDESTRALVKEFNPDTITCLNVLEHVEQDQGSVEAMLDCLQPGGHLVLIVPALPSLFSDLDVRYGHFRRYTRRDAQRLLKNNPNASIVRLQYFNLLGVFGWWFNHVLFKKLVLPTDQTQAFDRVVPTLAAIERVVPIPFGLSLVLWIRKQ